MKLLGIALITSVLGIAVCCGGDTLPEAEGMAGGDGDLGPGGAGSGGRLQGSAAGSPSSPDAGGFGGACHCADAEVTFQTVDVVVGTDDYEGDSSHVACGTYTRERGAPSDRTVLCTGQIAYCDVAGALEHADVVAALETAPTFYGSDPRPLGGSVFQVAIGSALIEVGAACDDFPYCVPVPAGVAELKELLLVLEEQQLAEGDCLGRCPDAPYSEHLGEPCSKYGTECPSDDRGCTILCQNGAWVSTDFECEEDLGYGGTPGGGGAGGGGPPGGAGGS